MQNIPSPDLTGGGKGRVIPWLPRIAEQLQNSLSWKDQNVWRQVVQAQPVAVLCREKIIDELSSMEWRIEPRDSTQRQELRSQIKYHTELFRRNREQGTDFVDLVSHVMGDALDLPFGSGVEVIRKNDTPRGKVLDYVLLDGATLFPTNNRAFPVVQRVDQYPENIVFPKHSINRLAYTRRREIAWNGWAFPPPQKIFVAINMISKGDNYYWKLLIDTPEAGILDLLDMDKDSAEAWISSFRDLMTGIDPFKIPVLYEHTTPANYLPFSRAPADIQFSEAIGRYDSIIAGGYGLSLTSIGLGNSGGNGGETLAGSIRQERNDRKRGIGVAKRKFSMFMDRFLPDSLEFQWIDPDDEQQVARGRAYLSLSTAYNNLIDKRVITSTEARAMLIGTGLSPVSLPEEISEEDKKEFDELNNQGNSLQKRENMLTATQPPSAGGQGEIRASKADMQIRSAVMDFLNGEETAGLHMDVSDFSDMVLETVETIYEDKRNSFPFFSFARHKPYPISDGYAVWRDFREYFFSLKSNFLSYCEEKLDNEEDLFDNEEEYLVSQISQDISKSIINSMKKHFGDIT